MPSIGGWDIVHITDRVIELRKDTPAYRRITNRPGYVRMRAEPGMDRKALVEKALEIARKNDAKVAEFVAKQYAPDLWRMARYQGKQVRLKQAFETPEDPNVIGVKRP